MHDAISRVITERIIKFYCVLYVCVYVYIYICSCCSVAELCLTFCIPRNCNKPGFPVLHYIPEFSQIHVYWVGDAIQQSHSLSPPSPSALIISQHQGLFQWVSSWASLVVKREDAQESACNAGDLVQSLDQEDPLKKGWQPTAVFLPGELQSMGSQSDTTEWLNGQADMLKWYLKKVL